MQLMYSLNSLLIQVIGKVKDTHPSMDTDDISQSIIQNVKINNDCVNLGLETIVLFSDICE